MPSNLRITEHTNPLSPSTISTSMKIMIVGLSFFGDWSGLGLRSINRAKKIDLDRTEAISSRATCSVNRLLQAMYIFWAQVLVGKIFLWMPYCMCCVIEATPQLALALIIKYSAYNCLIRV